MDRKNRRHSYAALCAGIFLIKFGFGIGVAFINVWMKYRSVTLVEIGVIGTATNIVGTCFVLFWGWFCNHFGGTSVVVTTGLLIGGILYPAYIVSNSFVSFLTLGALNGVARAMFNESAPLLALVTTIIGSHRMGSRYSRYRMWGTAGYVVSTVLAGILAANYGIPSALAIGSAAYLVGAAAVAGFVEDTHVKQRFTESQSKKQDSKVRLQDLLQRNLLVFTVTSTLNGLIQGAYGLFPLNLNRLGASEALIGISVAAGAAAEIPVMAYVGGLSDRIGRKAVLTFSYLVPTATLSLIGLLSNPYLSVMAFTLKGVSGGIDFSMSAIYLAEEVPPERRPLVYGLVNSLKSIGSIVGPYAVAMLADRYGMASMFLTVAAYNLIPASLFAFGTKARKPLPK
ncbi:MAG: MFS transporter [Candidatus Bathyarchaeia archaeon]